MQSLLWPAVASYCLFTVFIFYQRQHLRQFDGSSSTLHTALSVSTILGTISGLGFLAYYGWTIAWWAAAVIFLTGLVSSFIGFMAERLVGATAISLAGFVGWPLFSTLMWASLMNR